MWLVKWKSFCVKGVEPQTADTRGVNEPHFVAVGSGAAMWVRCSSILEHIMQWITQQVYWEGSFWRPWWSGHSEDPDDQEIPPHRIFNPEIYYLVRKRPPVHPVLSQLNSVYTLTSYIFKINFNIILASICTSSEWLLSFKFSDKNPVCISLFSHGCYVSPQTYPPWFNNHKYLALIAKYYFPHWHFLQSPVTSPHF
jgi:hypothetical protein